jgi:hypothetical protein
MKIRLLQEAERDLEIGADFYEAKYEGFGRYFADCLRSDIESLRFYGCIHEQYRGFYRSLAKRFPFSIFCKMTDGWIEIYAILDARQDPQRSILCSESPKTN